MIGNRIRDLRTSLHLSQGYVARVLGIDDTSYIHLEDGQRHPTPYEECELCKLFGVDAL